MKEGKKNKKIKSKKISEVLRIMAAGIVIITISGAVREGTKIEKYEPLEDKAYCTVLVYMDGSDLESDYGAATEDLKEMEDAIKDSGMKSDTLHIVVEAGGSGNWNYEAMRNKKYGRFCISADGISNKEELEARNMGDSDTLADFINYGTQSYPAEHYGLVLWNHGAGQILGFGSDSNFDDASMSLANIKKAFEVSDMKEKFDFVSIDACLMGNLELVSVLEKKTEYLIASEELEPQNGYDYAWIKTIEEEAKKNSEHIGKNVGESMLKTYEEYYSENDYKLTLSLIDVNAYEKFHNEFHKLATEILEKAEESLYQEIGKKRMAIQGFGSRNEGTAEIVDTMELIKIFADNTGKSQRYDDIEMLLQEMVVDKVTKGYSKEPSGISMYFPSGTNDWMKEDMKLYKTIEFCDGYEKFLDKYEEYLIKENNLEWRQPEKKKNKVTMEVDENTIDNIAGAYLTVFKHLGDEQNIYLISTDSDVTINKNGLLKAETETYYWGMKGQVLCLIETLNIEDYTEYIVPVLYNDEFCTMHIGFDEENPDGKINAITPVEVTKRQYELKKGDTIVPLYPVEQLEGAIDIYAESSSDVLRDYHLGGKICMENMEDGDGELEQIKVSSKDCLFGFMIQDTKQNVYYTDLVEGKDNNLE